MSGTQPGASDGGGDLALALEELEEEQAAPEENAELPELIGAMVATPMDRGLRDPAGTFVEDALRPSGDLYVVKRAPDDFVTLSLRAMAWFPTIRGDMRLDDGGGTSSRLDFSDDLDLDELEFEPAAEVGLRLGRHDIRLSGFTFSADEESVADAQLTFGSITIPAGGFVDGTVELRSARATYAFALVDVPGFRLSPLVSVYYFDVDAEVETVMLPGGALLKESADEQVLAPAVGALAEITLADFVIAADARGFFVEVGEVDGLLIDAAASLTWRPSDNLGLFAGYRVLAVDVEGSSGGSDFDFDFALHGPFAGGELRF